MYVPDGRVLLQHGLQLGGGHVVVLELDQLLLHIVRDISHNSN